MKIPIFMISLFIIIFAVQVIIRRSSNGFEKEKEEFEERERLARSTRKKGIDPSLFITPDISSLPFKEYEETEENKRIIKKQETVRKKSSLKMLYFSEPLTNTDIMLNYGANNFDMLITYEEHYNGYIRSLLEWAEELLALDQTDDARLVLENAVALHSDLGKTYILLAEIYSKEKNTAALEKLKSSAENSKLQLKSKVIEKIEEYIYG